MSARDKATGKEQAITIQSSGGLTKEDIERMVKDAETNAAADKARKEAIDAKNEAESLIHSAESNLSEYKEKLPADVADAVKAEIEKARGVLESGNAESIKEAVKNLANAVTKMGDAIYQAKSSSNNNSDSSSSSSSSSDDAKDAEFKERK